MSGEVAEQGRGVADELRMLVLIPTYNERENIGRIVPAVLAQDPRISVLVIDDSSPDGTAELVRAMMQGAIPPEAGHAPPAAGGAVIVRGEAGEVDANVLRSRLYLLERPGKEGLGRAYLDGFRWGLERGFDLLCEMDADFSHPPGHLPEFIEKSREADVVIGSRYVGGRVTVVNWPMKRLLLSFFGSWYARTITRLPVSDQTGGFNCFRREVLEEIDLDRIESNGYAFQIELKLRAWRKGFRLAELPIVFTERDYGDSKMSKRIVREAVWRVWKFRFLDMIGKLK